MKLVGSSIGAWDTGGGSRRARLCRSVHSAVWCGGWDLRIGRVARCPMSSVAVSCRVCITTASGRSPTAVSASSFWCWPLWCSPCRSARLGGRPDSIGLSSRRRRLRLPRGGCVFRPAGDRQMAVSCQCHLAGRNRLWTGRHPRIGSRRRRGRRRRAGGRDQITDRRLKSDGSGWWRARPA